MAGTTIRPGCSSLIGLNVLQVSSPPAHDQVEGKGGYIFASNTFYKQEPSRWSFQSRNNVDLGAKSTTLKARLWSAAECSRMDSPLQTLAQRFAQERLQSNVKRYYSTAISPELDDAHQRFAQACAILKANEIHCPLIDVTPTT